MSQRRRQAVPRPGPARQGSLVGAVVDVLDGLVDVEGDGDGGDPDRVPAPCDVCGGGPDVIDPRLMLATELSIRDGAVLLWGGTGCRPVRVIRALAERHGVDPGVPLEAQDPAFADVLLYGWPDEPIESVHRGVRKAAVYRGCVDDLGFLQRRGTTARGNLRAIRYFTSPVDCPGCRGTRRSSGTRSILGGPLADVARRPIAELADDVARAIADQPERSDALDAVGLRLQHLRELRLRSLFAVGDR